jgi:hypothetical protein
MTVRCEECNSPFDPKRYWQKFCSPSCRTKQSIRLQKEYVALGRKAKAQANVAPSKVTMDLFGENQAA